MTTPAQQQRRAFWLKTLHRWHWISSALCLLGMLLFSITGITLNHAAQIGAKPTVVTRTAQLPTPLLEQLAAQPESGDEELPPPFVSWISEQLSVRAGGHAAEWSDAEVYLSLPRPGGDAWLSIDRTSGEVLYEATDRGWIAYFNDLHKGRNTGAAWRWFIDIFAGACLVFCITGLFLLQLHAGPRPATWPLVGLGLVIPLVLVILFIH